MSRRARSRRAWCRNAGCPRTAPRLWGAGKTVWLRHLQRRRGFAVNCIEDIPFIFHHGIHAVRVTWNLAHVVDVVHFETDKLCRAEAVAAKAKPRVKSLFNVDVVLRSARPKIRQAKGYFKMRSLARAFRPLLGRLRKAERVGTKYPNDNSCEWALSRLSPVVMS